MPTNTDHDARLARAERKAKRLSCAVALLSLTLCATLLAAYIGFRVLSEHGSGFHELPTNDRIQTASVIALTEWRKSGSTLQAVVVDILKQAPQTEFHYKIGDEFGRRKRVTDEGTDYGDGEVLFFVGSPTTLEYAVAHRNGRITAIGDITIADFRELVRRLSTVQ